MKLSIDRSVALLGTGRYLPRTVVSNPELRALCSNYDEEASGDFSTWVGRVTHIHERRFIEKGETAATMAIAAAKRALDMAGVRPQELDLLIHASFTPSCCVPADHVAVAQGIGATATPSFTLMGACAGSVQGLAIAQGLLAGGMMRRILVTGAETISPTIDFGDPLTAILFGDGAGAAVLGKVGDCAGGILPPYLGFDYNAENIKMANANLPFSGKVVTPANNGTPPAMEKPYLEMTGGRSVLRNAVNAMATAVRRVLAPPGEGPTEEEMKELLPRLRLIPHQANGRIVDGLAKRLSIPKKRTTKTIYRYANISAASNLIALDYAMREGNLEADQHPETEAILAVREVKDPIRKGDLLVLPSIGAGYLYGAVGFVHAG